MYGDELTMVYDTYSILKTGKDSTGKVLPLTFTMGAGRQGGYIYASLPFVYLFGPTELGIRSLSVLSGLGIIILMYFLGKKLFENENIGLFASFLASISMWDIYLSRVGFEAHFALFLALFGIVCFLYKKYIPWAIFWGLTTLTYPTFKLTLPLIFLLLLWKQGDIKNLIKNKLFIIAMIILTVFAGVVVNETLRSGSEQRFSKINVFSNPDLQAKILQQVNEERSLSTLPISLEFVFYNRPIGYSRVLLENYLENLSPRFLYLRGDGNPRHNPGEWGMLYFIELPLLVFAILYMWKENKRLLIFLSLWILITPLATMLIGDPHALRNALMLPPFILLSSYMLFKFSKVLRIIFITCILIQLIFVLQRVYFLAPNKFASFWSSEAKKTSLEVINTKDKTKPIILLTKIDNIEYAYPVYAKIDPNIVIAQYGKFPKNYGDVIITDKITNLP
jgi:4-amino-4-deoxy-L-arabinose transferase-like glycosyltransferase